MDIDLGRELTMKSRFWLLVFIFCSLAFADDPKLRNGNTLACETYSYRDLIKAGKLDMLTIPAFYKEQGIKGISYNDMYFKSLDDAYLDQVVAAVKKADRIVTCYVIEGSVASADEAERKGQIEADKQKLRAAHKLGAPVARVNVGTAGTQEQDDTVGIERVVAAFKELLPLARELNIRVAIENHGGISRKADNIVKIIKATDPEWVGSLVDLGNFPAPTRYEEITKVAPYAFVTHVKVNEFDEQGEAKSYDFPKALEIVKKQNYKGPISIEYEGKGDPVEGVQKTRALILKYW
jgi:sugar phosphate isomerase/epimerase